MSALAQGPCGYRLGRGRQAFAAAAFTPSPCSGQWSTLLLSKGTELLAAAAYCRRCKEFGCDLHPCVASPRSSEHEDGDVDKDEAKTCSRELDETAVSFPPYDAVHAHVPVQVARFGICQVRRCMAHGAESTLHACDAVVDCGRSRRHGIPAICAVRAAGVRRLGKPTRPMGSYRISSRSSSSDGNV